MKRQDLLLAHMKAYAVERESNALLLKHMGIAGDAKIVKEKLLAIDPVTKALLVKWVELVPVTTGEEIVALLEALTGDDRLQAEAVRIIDADGYFPGVTDVEAALEQLGSAPPGVGVDDIKDWMIDWGVGANQVSAVDVPILDAAAYFVATEVEAALAELATGVAIQNLAIKDYHIDWGVGANQVSAVDVPIADVGGFFVAVEVEAALQELALAATITIADAGGFYAGASVEAALQELGHLTALTVAEVDQLENIGVTTISPAQWTLVGGLGWGRDKQNLLVQVNAANPAFQIDIDADILQVEDYNLGPINVTVDITVVGANGRDAGVEAANTWYAILVIYNPTTDAIRGLLTTTPGAPTLPAGYTEYRRVGWVRNDAGSNFLKFYGIDNWIWWDIHHQVITVNPADNLWHAVVCAAFIPPTSELGIFSAFVQEGVGLEVIVALRRTGSAEDWVDTTFQVAGTGWTDAVSNVSGILVSCDGNQSIDYKSRAVIDSVRVNVLGYYDLI